MGKFLNTFANPKPQKTATAIAHPNIAFIKYWGNRNHLLRLPATGSISMNLEGLTTRTRVTFDATLEHDQLHINGKPADPQALKRVSEFLALIRKQADIYWFARVDSENNFPMGTGIASSASAFAALSLAANAAAGLQLDEAALSRLARRGSGSACRSIPAGFVEWQAGQNDTDSFAASIAPPNHWNLVDCVAIISQEHKSTGSSDGHPLASTSPIQQIRIQQTPQNLETCRQAILKRDFDAFAQVTELDCNLMHAVMMTSNPALLYWQPATLAVMHAVRAWRKSGLPVCYTIDAGPNLHVIGLQENQAQITARLEAIPDVKSVVCASPGGAARLEPC
ncbi:MAG: diphosphomevalonate decarboxylase [Anaerolineales bacterium]|nr:diphosphomevalonate decarboxylase [Anaerolineales bacterium]